MPPRIFATGVTGYVGGDVLHTLLETHPLWEASITCLVRSRSRGAALIGVYPKINVVFGTLEDSEILEEEASKADVVLHWASSDHVGAASAIKKGLEKGKGGYWIHTSGTDILLNPAIFSEKKYVPRMVDEVKVYDDWDNIVELIAFPDAHSHRPCDSVVLSLASTPKVKTAIICPPTVWGRGRGTGSTRSHQIYELSRLILERGSKIEISPPGAKTFWPNIHLYDLARLYIEVIDAAVAELEGGKGQATWGNAGYYFAENGLHYWQDIVDCVAEEAVKQGYLRIGDIPVRKADGELTKAAGWAIWNSETSCKSVRAKELFGWEPKEKQLRDEISTIVKDEAARAGLTART